uniref:RING-type domain-containing protein n=1 Tax=Rhizophora mucronata TaxID=61149 RepID=A0A2P2IT65_RHIMU
MGSSSSRLGSRPLRARRNRSNGARLFSSVICGGSSSGATLDEIKDYPVLLDPAKHCDNGMNEVPKSIVESPAIPTSGDRSTMSESEAGVSSECQMTASEGNLAKHDVRNIEESNRGKCFSDSRELLARYQPREDYVHEESSRSKSGAEASSSLKDQRPSDASVNVLPNKDVIHGIENSENVVIPQLCPEYVHPSALSPQGLAGLHSDGVSLENHMGEATTSLISDSDRSHVPLAFCACEDDESIQEATSSGSGSLVSNREPEQRDGSVFHLDVLSISSSNLSGSNVETSSHEARRNNTRLFWDSFSRHGSRRHSDSPTFVFSADNTDDLVAHDRWLVDFSSELSDGGIGTNSRNLSSRIHSLNEQRRHSRSEIWERLRGALDDNGPHNTSCPTGIHPDGTCSCESFLTTEQTNTRASISRIVLLAEALFEVLDEIHRQPVSLSLSTLSLPAPESVVDSFPLKSHKNMDKVESRDDIEQCYICLAEYEEGDKIRVLPCHHEYHMSCVDKWLKEIHGVCPLCRGDVQQGNSGTLGIDSEIPST